MDKAAIGRSLSGYIAAFIVLGGWAASNYRDHTDVLEKLAQFEKYKSEENGKLREQEIALEKEKLRLETLAKQLEEVKAQTTTTVLQANAKLQMIAEKERKIAVTARLIAPLTQQADEEVQIKRLMDEYSLLGVDLHSRPPCNNPEAQTKFNRAKAIISQIRTRAKTAGVYAKYEDFIFTNSSSIRVWGDDCH